MQYKLKMIIKMTKRESIIDQIDIYLNMNAINGKLSPSQLKHLHELAYNYIDIGDDWRAEVEKVFKQNKYIK